MLLVDYSTVLMIHSYLKHSNFCLFLLFTIDSPTTTPIALQLHAFRNVLRAHNGRSREIKKLRGKNAQSSSNVIVVAYIFTAAACCIVSIFVRPLFCVYRKFFFIYFYPQLRIMATTRRRALPEWLEAVR